MIALTPAAASEAMTALTVDTHGDDQRMVEYYLICSVRTAIHSP